MSDDSYAPLGNADVRVGELVWPRSLEGSRSDTLQFVRLVDAAGTGLILDCSLVEIGNSEIVSLLMRVRNHAKKKEKEVALFNVPDTLKDVIRVCNLRSVLPAADDAVAARKLVHDLSSSKGKLRLWLVSNKAVVIGATVAACIVAGVAGWMMAG